MDDALKLYPDADVLVSFASLRSAYESTVEAMQYPQVNICLLMLLSTLCEYVVCVKSFFLCNLPSLLFSFVGV